MSARMLVKHGVTGPLSTQEKYVVITCKTESDSFALAYDTVVSVMPFMPLLMRYLDLKKWTI